MLPIPIILMLSDACAFQRSITNPERNVDVYINSERARNIKENRHLIRCCAECVLYCERQCIALRGDKERLNQAENPGNFLALMKVLAEHDSQLKAHLHRPRLRNATYVSPSTAIMGRVASLETGLFTSVCKWCPRCNTLDVMAWI